MNFSRFHLFLTCSHSLLFLSHSFVSSITSNFYSHLLITCNCYCTFTLCFFAYLYRLIIPLYILYIMLRTFFIYQETPHFTTPHHTISTPHHTAQHFTALRYTIPLYNITLCYALLHCTALSQNHYLDPVLLFTHLIFLLFFLTSFLRFLPIPSPPPLPFLFCRPSSST
jgi:hypothetical protein